MGPEYRQNPTQPTEMTLDADLIPGESFNHAYIYTDTRKALLLMCVRHTRSAGVSHLFSRPLDHLKGRLQPTSS